jgi:hypothetical protein
MERLAEEDLAPGADDGNGPMDRGGVYATPEMIHRLRVFDQCRRDLRGTMNTERPDRMARVTNLQAAKAHVLGLSQLQQVEQSWEVHTRLSLGVSLLPRLTCRFLTLTATVSGPKTDVRG